MANARVVCECGCGAFKKLKPYETTEWFWFDGTQKKEFMCPESIIWWWDNIEMLNFKEVLNARD